MAGLQLIGGLPFLFELMVEVADLDIQERYPFRVSR